MLADPTTKALGWEVGYIQLRQMWETRSRQLRDAGYTPSDCLNAEDFEAPTMAPLFEALIACRAKVLRVGPDNHVAIAPEELLEGRLQEARALMPAARPTT